MTDYYSSPRWTGELMDCSMPVTFDQYSNCSFGCIYCCVKGTRIRMADGTEKPIESINIGDKVLSYDTTMKAEEEDKVISFMARTVDEILDIELEDGTVISITGDHPIFVLNRGWIKASDLLPGDDVIKVLTKDDKERIITP
jgi:hypothetical protein